MNLNIEPGVYVLAVSGGVDSVVLLDLLTKQPNLKLIVAHFDHGIRADSKEDRLLVEMLAQKYGLPFEFEAAELGSNASEDLARQARYEYLRNVMSKHRANAIVTAHHQDDAVETMTFNILRGTKRKGMSSLQSRADIKRPLLDYTKADILNYAQAQGLVWREDSTNKDEKYARNWIRRKLLPKLSQRQKKEMGQKYASIGRLNEEINSVVSDQLKTLKRDNGLDRSDFIKLPYIICCEVMAAWLLENEISEINRNLIDKLVVSSKTLVPGKKVSIDKHHTLHIEPKQLSIH